MHGTPSKTSFAHTIRSGLAATIWSVFVTCLSMQCFFVICMALHLKHSTYHLLRCGGNKLERVRDLFEHALFLCIIRVGQNRIPIYAVYDRILGGFPAKNTVYTPYMYGSGQLYVLCMALPFKTSFARTICSGMAAKSWSVRATCSSMHCLWRPPKK